ncbi:MAG TPA: APC family permease [Ktedonobacteraceae bacterium]|nr:APC family permease [Ktedonobacteraceae bacterium]
MSLPRTIGHRQQMPSQVEVRGLPSEEYTAKAMPHVLTSRDFLALFIVILLFLTNVPTAAAGGAAGLTFWIVGGLCFFIPCAVVTAQLATMFPSEGGIYVWTHKAFGPYSSFFVGFCAWIPAPLLILATSDLFVTYVQSLNAQWLVQPWQQGIMLIALIAVTSIIALSHARIVQNLVNAAAALILCASFLIFLAGIVWLLKGQHSVVDFGQGANWSITWGSGWNPFNGAGNFGIFGVITLGYLGVNIPLNMAAEMRSADGVGALKQRSTIIRHLVWGTIIVLVGYLAVTFAVVVVQGSNAAVSLFSLVTTVDMAMGKFWGDVVAICIMGSLVVATILYNAAFSRWLLVAALDSRIPRLFGKLNRVRVPGNAIIFQSCVAVFLALVFFFVVPLLGGANGATLILQVYFVGVAAATLIWAFATIFLFINFLKIFARHRANLHNLAILPVPLVVFCAVVGLITGAVAMVDTLFVSAVPTLVSNGQWFVLVGGTSGCLLILGVLAAMFGTSQAAWEGMENTGEQVPLS